MADFARFLPLSNRERRDESGVSADRRAALADLVVIAADHLGRARATDFLLDARLDREFRPEPSPEDDATALREIAEQIRVGSPRSVRALADGLRALLILVGDTRVTIDPITTGAVVLWALPRADRDRRAALSGRTLRATDADWVFGQGPEMAGPAQDIAAFVLGVSEVPPPLTRR